MCCSGLCCVSGLCHLLSDFFIHKKGHWGYKQVLDQSWIAGAQGYSLEAQVQDLQPNPGQNQQHQHGGEGEGEPGGKVDDATIFFIDAGKCRWLLASKTPHSLLSFINESEKGKVLCVGPIKEEKLPSQERDQTDIFLLCAAWESAVAQCCSLVGV